MGDNRQSEQKRQEPATPDTGTANAQADDNSNETSVTSQQRKKRGHFISRLQKRRSTASAEQADTRIERSSKKPKIGLLGIVVTALVGFFFGIGSNQVTDYIKRADDCSDALSEFDTGVSGNFTYLSQTVHDGKATYDQILAARGQYNNLIASPEAKIENKCLAEESNTEYLNPQDIKHFEANWSKLSTCFTGSKCSQEEASSYAKSAADSACNLDKEARKVAEWGLWHRAKYLSTHLW
jgi:hypothetical protein